MKPGCLATLVSATLVLLVIVEVGADPFVTGPATSFLSLRSSCDIRRLENSDDITLLTSSLKVPRGGAVDSDDDESDYEDSDDEEEEEEEEEDTVLSKSFQKAAAKVKAKEVKKTKSAVSETLLASTPRKKQKQSVLLMFPYILRACLNPFELFRMTKGYFASLVNLDYLQSEVSQDLRTALDEKAKKKGSNASKRTGKRKMKPGQAKTLSDLPQLNT